jgi:hypothetical protein
LGETQYPRAVRVLIVVGENDSAVYCAEIFSLIAAVAVIAASNPGSGAAGKLPE